MQSSRIAFSLFHHEKFTANKASVFSRFLHFFVLLLKHIINNIQCCIWSSPDDVKDYFHMLTKLITSYASFHQKIESIQCDACLAITEPQRTKFNKN